MPSGFTTGGTDFDNQFIRREFFQQGTLWGWGYNYYGSLGDNTNTQRNSPVQTVAWGLNWMQVSCGQRFSAGIKNDGTLWTWGLATNGQLGNNTNGLGTQSPTQTVAAGTNWKQVSAGGYTCGAIKTDGTLWMWGQGANGNLGNNGYSNRSSPVQTIAAGNNWKQISVSYKFTGAIKTDGTLWMWGINQFGDLGTNNQTDYSSPVQTIAVGTNWKQVSAGGYSTSAIKTDGTLWVWGWNIYGQLGTNDTNHRSSPVQTVAGGTNWKQVTGSKYSWAAIKTDGTLWTWGVNTNGQLGTNNITNYSSPVQTVAGGTNWKQVSAGGYAMAAIKTDGTLWTWGVNNTGNLGTNDTTKRSSPIQTVAGGTNWKQVSASGPILSGDPHTMAITTVN